MMYKQVREQMKGKTKMKKVKQNRGIVDTYMGIRKTWEINPVNRIKGNVKKDISKKACRGKSKGDN